VRLRKRLLRARVKGHLPIIWTDEELSAHAGLALIGRFLESFGWIDRLRSVFEDREFDCDYGSLRMSLCMIGLLLVGGRRLVHLRELEMDPVFRRFARVGRIPSVRTLSRWLKTVTEPTRDALLVLLRDVAFETWAAAELRRVTLDMDGTVIRAGERAQDAARGFNPHHPKDPSYYPLTTHLAQTGQMIDVVNRPGNVNDSRGAADRLRFLIADVRQRLGNVPIEIRLDGAFCQNPILELLTASGVEFAMRMPMWKWLDVRQRISSRETWVRVNDRVSAFSMQVRIETWKRTERIVVFRKRISGKPSRNFQLDLFQPDDGYFEYSMVVTNKNESESTIWAFMAGRGAHEKTLAELKHNVAFGSVVTDDWDANCTWQIMSALTHNLMRHFQLKAGLARPRINGRKRTYRFSFMSMRSLRFLAIHLPARVARPAGKAELRIAAAPMPRKRLEAIERSLAA